MNRSAIRRALTAWREATTWRDLAYVLLGFPVSVVAFALTIAIIVNAGLIVIVLSIPPLILFVACARGLAILERRRAALVLDGEIPGLYRRPRSEGWLERLRAAATDPQTYKDLSWIAVVSILGFAAAVAAVALIGTVLGMVAYPLWMGWLPDDADTTLAAWLYPPAGLLLALLTAWIVRGMARVQAIAASLLLGPSRRQWQWERLGGPPPGARFELFDSDSALPAHIALSAIVAVALLIVWAATSRGNLWPEWAWLGLAVPLAIHAGLRYLLPRYEGRERWFAAQALVSAVLGITELLIWAFGGAGYFWPIWPLVGLSALLAIHAVWLRLSPAREQELEERVTELTRTRRGALDVQADELRRIERDLHDGAQARLVSLSMRLGRAEEGLADQPEAAELVRQARDEASAAIAELRDLARGIAPPVLTDRGLGAAVDALGQRAAVPVGVEVEMDRRPPSVIENAAYFVVAESLTNVAKHAPDATAQVNLSLVRDVLTVEVADDGGGGADPEGGGLSGLRQRVEALDGTLLVVSPPGEGTTIHAALPCG